jgi:hypothetical protein
MSLAELQAELQTLTPVQLAKVESTIRQMKVEVGGQSPNWAEFFGCARGTVTFRPGWDENEPLEMWHAMRDDLPL